MTELLANLRNGNQLTVTFQHHRYGIFVVEGPAILSPSVKNFMVGSLFIESSLKPEKSVLAIESSEAPAFDPAEGVEEDREVLQKTVDGIGHGDLVFATFAQHPHGRFTITGLAVSTSDHEILAVGTWFMANRTVAAGRLVEVSVLTAAGAHLLPVPGLITNWDPEPPTASASTRGEPSTRTSPRPNVPGRIPPVQQRLQPETAADLATRPWTVSRQNAIHLAATALGNKQAVVLDTELTDFAGRIIELGVLSMDGTALLDTLVNPEGAAIRPQAQQQHGIDAAMLVDAPTMTEVWPQLDAVLQGKTVITWNASFDQARVRAEYNRISGNAPEPEWLARPWECAMRWHAVWAAVPNARGTGFRSHKLDGGHRAIGDCRAALDRLRQMAGSTAAG
ncbi:3'-5' exonuclease [Crossiella sp. SN42]|uniref:3'-5' exonuclease n=1 Tax=Crossiella sp. SN42 TaxID=2944808 RepID=UPI00207C8ED4|nr:3'-5' exonuclease [Crossiella sp. SN42]MCO1575128.1 3'-5' exonuclease [Crossiella sp. SN42]